MNARLVNVAAALLIVCAIAFLALWAWPRVSSAGTAAQSQADAEAAAQAFVADAYEADWGTPLEDIRPVARDEWQSHWDEVEAEESHPFVRSSDWTEVPAETEGGGPFFFSGTNGGQVTMIAVWKEPGSPEWSYRERP